MTRPIFAAVNIEKRYPGVRALAGVSVEVYEKEVMAVIGPNGAGKSTLFGVVSGQFKCDRGRVEYKGKDITGYSPWQTVRQGISRCFQIPRIFPNLRLWENVLIALLSRQRLSGAHAGLSGFMEPERLYAEKIAQVLAEVGLEEAREQFGHSISHGDKKRLELAMALVLSPDLLLLDEPTAGMSPSETKDTVELIKEISNRRGLTLLLTEHDMAVVFSLADRISVINKGELIASGVPQRIRNDPLVIETYLGTEDEDNFES